MADLNTVLYQNPGAGQDSPLLGYWQLDGTDLTPQVSQSPSANPGLAGYEFIGTGNFDGDATDDVLWSKSVEGGYETIVWFMNADNSLRASATIALSGETAPVVQTDSFQAKRIADFDGDGNSDIFFRQAGTNNFQIWQMDGSSATLNAFNGTALSASLGIGLADDNFYAIGDFDGNGALDIGLRDSVTGAVGVALLDTSLDLIPPASLPTPESPNLPTESGFLTLDGVPYALSSDWELLGVTDLNAQGGEGAVIDNNDDIVLRNTQTGQVIGWLMNGSSIQAWDFLGQPVTNDFDFEGFGDFNGDGNGDLLWRSKSSDQSNLGMWLTGATADGVELIGADFVTLSGSTDPYALPAQWDLLGFQNVTDAPRFADFNNDGNADIYLHNTATGEAILWSMNGTVIDSWGFVEFEGNTNPAPAGWAPIGLLSTTTGVTPPQPGTGTGLTGNYFNTIDFTGASIQQTDPTIDFDWGDGQPLPTINADNFSVTWDGFVQPLYSEEYTFYVTVDDGVTLTVGGNELINDPTTDQPATEFFGTINLVAGQLYDIDVDYFEAQGQASIVLEWESASQIRQVIPSTQLYSNSITA